MITTSTISTAVDVTLNLVIPDETSTTMERNKPEKHNEQFLFIDENDKNELQLSNESTIPDWTEVMQISETVIDNNNRYNKSDDESSKKSAKVTTSSDASTFDFTKIETLFSNSTATSSTDKAECDEINAKDDDNDNDNDNDNREESNVSEEKKDIYSLNGALCDKKKSSSLYDEKSIKNRYLNRYDQNSGKEKKRKIKEINSRGSSISPSFQRSLTPSLDPKLLKQFEEEDRPKRVLRSSTIASTNKIFPIMGNVLYSTQLNEEVKQNRSQSKDINKETELHSKRLRTEIDGLLDNELMVTFDDLRNTSVRPRHWSGASSSRASTSSGSNEFTVITKMRKRRDSSSRNRRNNFNSNWKLIGLPYESSVYIDYFFHENQSIKQICYPQAVHSKTGDLLRLRDSVRVNSIDGEPNFACICRLFNDSKTGMPLASVLWYYTPMQVKADNSLIPPVFERELLASKHMDIIPLDTVDEIVWVLTYNEYGRFMAETRNDTYPLAQRVSEEDLLWKKGEDDYPRRIYLPRDDTPLELVYFCRRIYDCKQQKVETKKLAEKNNQMKRLRRHPWKYRTKKQR
ncbi:hypothetical protein QQG55_36165 [Brugia pahangi]